MSDSSQSQTFNQMWEQICNSFDYIFHFQTIRYSKWMLTYTCIFDFCTKQSSDTAVLYESIANYFHNLCLSQSTEGLQDRDIVGTYTDLRRKFSRSSQIIHGICSYLNRHHVSREFYSGHSDVCEIYTLAMKTWNQIIGPVFYPRISDICLSMIKSERQNEKIDIDILANIVQIFISSDINKPELTFDLYREYVEKPFLEETQEFYRIEATTYLQQHSVIDYLSKINDYIDDETRRVTLYLHSSTFVKVIQVLEDILIREQLEILHTEAKKCTENENLPEVNLLYRTVSRIENGKNRLKNLFEDHVNQVGQATIEPINRIPTNSIIFNPDLKLYIETIANLHQKYSLFIQTAFDNDFEFTDSLNRTFERLLNNNPIENTRTMAKSLAQYSDKLLRKKRQDDLDHETFFHQIKIILTYIHDKDTFVSFYAKFLLKRLINQTTISNDYEKLMITNIQTACGFEYVSKMKRMYQDIETSEHILNQYLTSKQIDSKIRFSVFILNSQVWSLTQSGEISLPRRFQLISNDFNEFYKQLYHGRKLTWFHQYSKGELRGYFQNKFYAFQVSMYQMLILLLFNETVELTIEQIQDATQIPIHVLIQVLNLLINSNILQSKQPIDSLNIDMNYLIRLVEDFASHKHCINLNQPLRFQEESEIESVNKSNDRDRLALLRAALVRTMKAHQILNERLLIQTVMEQLSSRFSYEISVVQDCIEMLINGEYFQRDGDRLLYKN